MSNDQHNYQGQPYVALAGKLGGCRSNRRQMRAHGLSFRCLPIWRNLGDLSWRRAEYKGKGKIVETNAGSRLILQNVEWGIGVLGIGMLWPRCC